MNIESHPEWTWWSEVEKAVRTNATSLRLRVYYMEREHAEALARVLRDELKELTDLDLNCSRAGPDMLQLIPSFPKTLVHLRLVGTDIGDEEARMLVEHMPTKLAYLYLGSNHIGPEGIDTLCEHFPKTLLHLDISYNDLGSEGVQALASRMPPKLNFLDLSGNNIGDDGVRALASCLFDTNIVHLTLNKNEISHEGVYVLLREKTIPKSLTHLSLGANNIGKAGARALSEYGPKSLTYIYLASHSHY